MQHNWLDIGNGIFESGGAICIWLNVLRLKKDKELKGVDWRVTMFFTLWGFFNMLLYPSLQMWLSVTAGAALCLGNLVWVWMAISVVTSAKKSNILENSVPTEPALTGE